MDLTGPALRVNTQVSFRAEAEIQELLLDFTGPTVLSVEGDQETRGETTLPGWGDVTELTADPEVQLLAHIRVTE